MSTPRTVAHHVLVVEDDAETSETLKTILEEHGYRVTLAKDGGQAHAKFSMRKPDFVVLDVILPGESGFEVCDRLKTLDERVPVLILSVIDMDDARNLATRVGADGYLVKPVDPETLVEQIEEIATAAWDRFHSEPSSGQERIRFRCSCGKRFKVSPVHRGRTMTCPDCGESLVVPRHA